MAAGSNAGPAIGIETLTEGGQRPADVARGIAGFLSQARVSLDLALYDVRFETDAGALADIRARDLRVVPHCPFVIDYIRRHPEERDLVGVDPALPE